MEEYIPYGKHNISNKDIEAVIKALKSEFITQGNLVPKFENLVSKKVGANFAVAVNSATSALHIACLALGLKKGDILWTSSNTFVSSANCGKFCGAEVDFVDINPQDGLMSICELEKKLISAKKKSKLPKIIIPVHLCGASCEMEEIYYLSRKFGFSIIEDASHAIGGRYNDEPIGCCKFSNIAIFSFHPVKIITTGEGGIATTNDEYLAKKMINYRSHGIVKDPKELNTKFENGSWYYEQKVLGFNYRLTDIQAALGISQLSRLEKIVAKRHKIKNNYKELLLNLPIDILETNKKTYSSLHLLVIRLRNKCPIFHKLVFENLRAQKIGVQLHYLPVHLHPYYRKQGFKEGDFPNAELYSKNAISLPIFPELTLKEQHKIVDALKNALLYADES